MPIVWSYLSLSVSRLLGLRPSRGDENGAAALTSKALSVPLLREAMPDLRIELSRARRYERPFSVLLFTALEAALEETGNGPVLNRLEKNGGRSGAATIILDGGTPQLTSLLVGAMLRDLIRRTDHIAYAAAHDRLLIALPETDREQAHQAFRRLEPEMRARVKMTFGAGVAAFPEDGFTFPDLIEQAKHHSTRQPLDLDGGRPPGRSDAGG